MHINEIHTKVNNCDLMTISNINNAESQKGTLVLTTGIKYHAMQSITNNHLQYHK